MKRKLNMMILKSVLPVVFAGVLLIVALFVEANNVFGWFANNKNVNASGMQVNPLVKQVALKIAYGEFDGENWNYGEWVELNDSTVIDFTQFDIPNSKTRFKVQILNISEDASIDFSEFGFQSYTDQDEKPRVVDGTRYYLGTQITVSIIGETEQYLSEYQDGTDLLTESTNLILYSGNMEILANETYELEIEATFVETDLDQSNYSDFGSGSECCKRKLYFIF